MNYVVKKYIEGYEMNFDGDDKKYYQPPELESYGDVRDVTLSISAQGVDSFYGEDEIIF